MIPFLTMAAAFLAAVLAYYFLRRKGVVSRALLPAFLYFSFIFTFQASPGLPSLTIYSTMCLVVAASVWYIDRPVLRLQMPDLLVVAYMLSTSAVILVTSGSKEATHEFLGQLISIVIPYFLIRMAVPAEEVPRFLVAMVVCTVPIALLSPLEAFFSIRITDPLQAVWPSFVSMRDFYRGGFNRVAASFGHPIHAGMIFTIVAVICWFFFLADRLGRRSRWIMRALFFAAAIYLTGSRSSYVFSLPILAMVYFHFARRKAAFAFGGLLIAVVVLTVALPAYEAYAGASDLSNADETQTSAAYRKQLGESYLVMVGARPITGWGANLPVMNGQGSIDNAYLLYSLIYGVPVTVLFWTIGASAAFLGVVSYVTRNRQSLESGLVWLMISCLVFIAICAYVVWLNGQALQSYFLLTALLTNLVSRETTPRPLANLRWI